MVRPQTRGRWRTKDGGSFPTGVGGDGGGGVLGGRGPASTTAMISTPGVANGKQIAENIQQRHLVTLCDPLSIQVGASCKVVVCCEPSLRRRVANRGLRTGSQRGRTSSSL